jgi:hypothetical protein
MPWFILTLPCKIWHQTIWHLDHLEKEIANLVISFLDAGELVKGAKLGSLATPAAARKSSKVVAAAADEQAAGLTGILPHLQMPTESDTPCSTTKEKGADVEGRKERRVVEFDVVREMDSFW